MSADTQNKEHLLGSHNMVLSLSKASVHRFVYKVKMSRNSHALREFNELKEAERSFAKLESTHSVGEDKNKDVHGQTPMTLEANELFAYIMERVLSCFPQSGISPNPDSSSFASKTAAAASAASASPLPPLKSAVDMTWTDKYRPLHSAVMWK